MDLNKKAIVLILITVLLFIVVFVFFIITPVEDGFDFFIRLGALFGFTAMFIATTMSPFMVQLYKIFGKSFIKLHHIFSIFGLIMITLHPVMFAISKMDITVFIPDVSSWIKFWELAGRPAFFIIYIAALAAILRKSIQKYWRKFHVLNYIALLFVYIHGVLIGTDFQNPMILILFSVMLIISISSFALKRYQTYTRKQRLRQKEEANNE